MQEENMTGTNQNWFNNHVSEWLESGWDTAEISQYLEANASMATEALMRVEYFIQASKSLIERMSQNWLERLDLSKGLFGEWIEALTNPMDFPDINERYEQWAKINRRWELVLNNNRGDWESVMMGEERSLILARCDALDESSKIQLNLIIPLMNDPHSFTEIDAQLSEVEQNEARQKRTIYSAAQALREAGYNIESIDQMNLVDALQEIAEQQKNHNFHEMVRLQIIDEIAEFDDQLADRYEAERKSLMRTKDDGELTELSKQISSMGSDLKTRLYHLNIEISNWVNAGINFSTTSIVAKDLFEWEVNLPELSNQIDGHLALVARFQFFEQRMKQTPDVKQYIGYLEHSEALAEIIDQLDLQWKDTELQCYSIIEKYQTLGLYMDDWGSRIASDPFSALGIIKHDEIVWNKRIDCVNSLLEIDISYSGKEEIEKRINLLKEVEAGEDIISDTESMIARLITRGARHRKLLERDLLELIGQGKASENTISSTFNLAEFEDFVAQARQYGTTTDFTNTGNSVVGGKIGERIKTKIAHELNLFQSAGWYVNELNEMFDADPMLVAKMLAKIRPAMAQHDSLRRRLSAMPWNRNVRLALQIQEEMQNPLRLTAIAEQIPKMMRELSKYPVEDEDFAFTPWSPAPIRKTLLPVPEQIIEPADSLEEAHEAMLEAMEEASEIKVAEEELEQESTVKVTEQNTTKDAPLPPREEVPKRARDVQGKFVGDDLSTDDYNEAWIGGKAPKTKQTVQKVSSVELNSLEHLHLFMSKIGLIDSFDKSSQPDEQVVSMRKSLAKQVGKEPRDVRFDRLLRLVLRLLPQGNEHDEKRKWLIMKIAANLKKYQNWVKMRLEARHKAAKGNLVEDSLVLGKALQRIPGPGFKVPLEKDEKALPAFNEIKELEAEVKILIDALNLQSASGVVVSAN
ncbi:MAG: hypothetical protein HON10_05060 [Euryarchaeota archaeon]|jgi:hypothetical protein|nr:hypothetical protein [Euryarchaeota archaeon]MBT7987853.1 hypothetical protein [Euryarchaeota archaeon]